MLSTKHKITNKYTTNNSTKIPHEHCFTHCIYIYAIIPKIIRYCTEIVINAIYAILSVRQSSIVVYRIVNIASQELIKAEISGRKIIYAWGFTLTSCRNFINHSHIYIYRTLNICIYITIMRMREMRYQKMS